MVKVSPVKTENAQNTERMAFKKSGLDGEYKNKSMEKTLNAQQIIFRQWTIKNWGGKKKTKRFTK